MLRPAIAADPRLFGKGPLRLVEAEPASPAILDDIRLFATSFAAGFLFVAVLIF
jgi:hypothetical protein